MPDPTPRTPGRRAITDPYAAAVTRLRAIIAGTDYTQAAKRKAAEKIASIRDEVTRLRRVNRVWAARYIPEAYKIGFHQDDALLERYLEGDYAAKFSQLHRDAAMVVAEGAVANLDAVADAIEQTYTDYIRRAQIEAARSQVARSIASGIIEGQSRRTTSRMILDDLRDRLVEGKITVGRVTMRADAYADLLARTVTRAARTEGTVNRLTENEMDLVIMNNTGAVDFCTEYEDQIFSISGTSRKYPRLTARPPFHPNCTHVLSPFVEEFAAEGEIERGTQFKREDLDKSAAEMAKKYPQRRAA